MYSFLQVFNACASSAGGGGGAAEDERTEGENHRRGQRLTIWPLFLGRKQIAEKKTSKSKQVVSDTYTIKALRIVSPRKEMSQLSPTIKKNLSNFGFVCSIAIGGMYLVKT